MTNRPSVRQLRRTIDYGPDTGDMVWLPRASTAWNGRWAGKTAGSINAKGYRVLSVHPYGPITAHRIAWALVTGEWPPEGMLIDHANGDGADNRWVNLRLATPGENSRNRRTASEFKGVRQTKSGRYRAHITLGVFDTAEEAAAAYDHAARLYHGLFAAVNLPEAGG